MIERIKVARRVYFSMPADLCETPEANALKWAVVEAVEAAGYDTEIFTDPRGRSFLTSGLAWTMRDCDLVLRRCIGAVVIGAPRFLLATADREFRFATEYCHYEGAVACTLGLPLLVLAESDIEHRVMFGWSSGAEITTFPRGEDERWLQTQEFRSRFDAWLRRLQHRRDVFLGYCSSSSSTASAIREYLEALGVTVLDWQRDFAPAMSILEEIQAAAGRCSAGIFLFTQDDGLQGAKESAAPRDNVVFEAGYFAQAKGKARVLIVREAGTKMPADLGGDIYAALPDRNDISPIKTTLLNFIVKRL